MSAASLSLRTSTSIVENSGVEPGITPGQADPERVARRPAHDDVRPVTFPCPRTGMQTNFVNAFSSATNDRIAAEFRCFPRVIVKPIPDHPEPSLLHALDEVLEHGEAEPGLRDAGLVHRPALEEGTERGEHLEVLPRTDLEEDVRELHAGGLPDVDQDHRPTLPAQGHVLALRGQGVSREVERGGSRRIASQ